MGTNQIEDLARPFLSMVNNRKIDGYLDYKGKYLFTDTYHGCVLADRYDMHTVPTFQKGKTISLSL